MNLNELTVKINFKNGDEINNKILDIKNNLNELQNLIIKNIECTLEK